MVSAVEMLSSYISRVVWSFLSAYALLLALPRGTNPKQSNTAIAALRLSIHLYLFLVLRDALTPEHIWYLRRDGWQIHLGFIDSPPILVVLGFASLMSVLAMYRLEPQFESLVVVWRNTVAQSVYWGVAGAVAIVLPSLVLKALFEPPVLASEPWNMTHVLAVLFMALLGNLYEEYLFRTCFQGVVSHYTSASRAALISGMAFCAFHSHLAAVVTDVGLAVHLFTLYEGVICGFLHMHHGLLCSTLAHGGGIFLLATCLSPASATSSSSFSLATPLPIAIP